jgi:DNA-binding transcriptional LysR family regulator
VRATAASTRIPIRLEPLPGESFDGWLDAYAQRLRVSGIELGIALGVPPRLLRLRGANVARGDPSLDPQRVAAHACGVDPARIAALWSGLQRYDRLVAGRVGCLWLARALKPQVSSRYCPSCLRESAGRWLAAWRLPWYLACPMHETMLAAGCPQCSAPQRKAGLRSEFRPNLMTSCSHSATGRHGRLDHRCGHDLTANLDAEPAPVELLALQAELAPIVDPAQTDRHAVCLIDRLVDLLVIATRCGFDPREIDRDRRNTTSLLAGPFRDAYRALADPRGERLRALAIDNFNPLQGALPHAWRGVSPVLARVLLEHRDQRLRAADRLRYRSMTGAGRRPEGTDPAKRMRSIPLALWPDWSIRLRPETIEPNTFRVAAAIALCIPGATASIRTIREHWPGPRFTQRMAKFGRLVTADPHSTAILSTLCRLADDLDRGAAQIEYARRRALASQIVLLDANGWRIMCRAAGTPVGAARKLRWARLWLWETLTGGLPAQAPAGLQARSADELADYSRFTIRLPGDTARRLCEHARDLLEAHGCHDEPVTWSPSAERVAIAALPGPDPDEQDARRVHAALDQQLTPSRAAASLGITVEHLRYLARTYPAPGPAAMSPPMARLAAHVTPEQLRKLLKDGHSLRAVAARHGVAHKTVHDELIAHGIPIPERGWRRHAIQRDWLHEQYVVNLHTMAQIAAEAGVSISTIRKLLHEHAIPVRAPGTSSHQQSLTAGHGFPEPLASAVHGQGGADRVRRFQVYARAHSLTAGAERLGVQQYSLTLQLATLETACGAPLLQRRTRAQRRQRATELGKTLLQQADQHLGPNAAAPSELPEPLATVLAANWGEKKLARLVAITASPTLEDSATALGIQPDSLQRSIRTIERLLGQAALTDRRRSTALRLTPIARRLLQQAATRDTDG